MTTLNHDEQPDEASLDGMGLVVLENLNPVTVFTNVGGGHKILDAIKAQVLKIDRDVSTPKGRANIKSLAYRISTLKSPLDDSGKDLKSPLQKQVDLIDGERKVIRDGLDALKEEIRRPLTEYEDRQRQHIQLREDRIATLINLATPLIPDPDVETIDAHLAQLDETQIFDWLEFSVRAEIAAKETRARLIQMKAERIQRDHQAAEDARIKAEQEAAERQEREERIAAEAAANAKHEAEEKAERDRIAAQQEAERKQREADQRAADEKARADKSEADRIAAAEKAEKDLIAAQEKADRDAKAAAEKSAQDERDRITAEQKAEADATAKREADKKHKAKINNEALNAILSFIFSEDPEHLSEMQRNTGKILVEAIAKGQIPNVKIKY